MVQGNSGNVTAALQQMQVRTQQIPVRVFFAWSCFHFFLSSFLPLYVLYILRFSSSVFPPQQDIKSEVNMGNMQRSLPMDPSSIYGQGGMQSKSGITNAGLNYWGKVNLMNIRNFNELKFTALFYHVNQATKHDTYLFCLYSFGCLHDSFVIMFLKIFLFYFINYDYNKIFTQFHQIIIFPGFNNSLLHFQD